MCSSFNVPKFFAIGCIIAFAISCHRKNPSANIQDQLKKSWLTYLESQPNYDSTRVHFEIKDVYFFADTAAYICEFKVRMQVPSKKLDTVGMMDGTISKDFSVVHRKD
jgi:hypothetical protein